MGANESKRFTEFFPETPENNRVREMQNVSSDPRSPGHGIIERTPMRGNLKFESPIYEEIADPRSPTAYVPRTPITQLKDMARNFEDVIQKVEEPVEQNSDITTADLKVMQKTPVKPDLLSPPTSPGAALTIHEDKGLLKEARKSGPVIHRRKKHLKKAVFKLTEDGQPPRSPLTPRNSEVPLKAGKKRTTKISLNSKNRYKNFTDAGMSPLNIRGAGEIGMGKENSNFQVVL